MTFTADDARYMTRALQLARRGLYTTDPNPRVGCVVVKDDRIVGEGWHRRVGEPHAEILALRAAGARARGATAYVTLEPCCHQGRTPPCTETLIKAGVARVAAAMRDPHPQVDGKGFEHLQQHGIVSQWGLLEAQAAALNPGFLSRMQRGRPYVRIKLAASLDGRTALASGESKWISGEAARADVQRWRARSSAILTSIATILADDPQMTVRDIEVPRQPLRVIVDSRLRTPSTAQLLRQPGPTLVVCAANDSRHAEALRQNGAEILRLPARDGKVDLTTLVRELAARAVNELLVEAGPTLCGALLADQLVDELVLYLAPHLLGDAARGLFHVPFMERMDQRIALEITDLRAIGQDWRITAKVATGHS